MSILTQAQTTPESDKVLVAVLAALLEYERLTDQVLITLAAKIVDAQTCTGLSAEDVATFDAQLAPQLTIACEGHCEGAIPLAQIPAALFNEFDDYGLYCERCCRDIRILMRE